MLTLSHLARHEWRKGKPRHGSLFCTSQAWISEHLRKKSQSSGTENRLTCSNCLGTTLRERESAIWLSSPRMCRPSKAPNCWCSISNTNSAAICRNRGDLAWNCKLACSVAVLSLRRNTLNLLLEKMPENALKANTTVQASHSVWNAGSPNWQSLCSLVQSSCESWWAQYPMGMLPWNMTAPIPVGQASVNNSRRGRSCMKEYNLDSWGSCNSGSRPKRLGSDATSSILPRARMLNSTCFQNVSPFLALVESLVGSRSAATTAPQSAPVHGLDSGMMFDTQPMMPAAWDNNAVGSMPLSWSKEV